jgi:NitT/TauT family transport system ATP-binding protein
VIFQDYGLLPWKTVQANAELPLALARLPRSIRRERAGKLLAEFGLAPFTKLYPRQLSGGMKQRLAIVRALAPEPDLLLMDEPFSSLDALSREDAQDLLLSIRKKRPLTIVMVTHSIEEAVYLADRVFVITGKNPGTLSATVDIPDGIHRGDSRFQECCASLRRLLRPSALPDVPSSALSERLTGGPGRG